jgi:mRNA interferase MazF
MLKHKIVLVPFPFDDLSVAKVRPALCLTNAIGPHQHVVVAFITSQLVASPLATDIILDSTSSDFSSTGLRASSTLQLHRLMTVTVSLIHRELGVLSPRLQAEIELRLRGLFELT